MGCKFFKQERTHMKVQRYLVTMSFRVYVDDESEDADADAWRQAEEFAVALDQKQDNAATVEKVESFPFASLSIRDVLRPASLPY